MKLTKNSEHTNVCFLPGEAWLREHEEYCKVLYPMLYLRLLVEQKKHLKIVERSSKQPTQPLRQLKIF